MWSARLTDEVIIDTPAQVFSPGKRPVIPPTISVWILVKLPEGINKSTFNDTIKPSAFFGKKSRNVAMSFRMVDVDGFMANVEVAADEQIGAFFLQFEDKSMKIPQKIHFEILTGIAHTARRYIDAQNTPCAKIRSNHPSLHVIDRIVHPNDNPVRFCFR